MNERNKDVLRGVVLDAHAVFTVREFCRVCDVDQPLIQTMVEEGVIEPLPDQGQLTFHGEALLRARRALRLVDDLGLNWPGAALALDLLERLERLESIANS
jgi:chaperone modulatory protein CbpM